MAEDGNMVELTVCQGFNFVPDSNSNDKFLTDCENQDTVVIFSQYGFERIFTPWSDTYSSVTIPEDICRNVKKKDGWEMAFCALGNNAGRDLNFTGKVLESRPATNEELAEAARLLSGEGCGCGCDHCGGDCDEHDHHGCGGCCH